MTMARVALIVGKATIAPAARPVSRPRRRSALSSLLERGALVRDETEWHLDLGISGEVPHALERLVRSRVDRLGPEPRQAIVAASVLGTEFGLEALGAVADLGDRLGGAVSELCSGGLLVELGQFPELAYRFRHGLIQEVT